MYNFYSPVPYVPVRERRSGAKPRASKSAHTGTTANPWLHRAEGKEKRERRGWEGEERQREGVRRRGRKTETQATTVVGTRRKGALVAVTRKKRRARKNGRDKEIETGRTVKKGQAETRKQRQKIGVHQTTGSQVTVTVPHPAREPSTPSIGSRV